MTKTCLKNISYCVYNISLGLVFSFCIFYITSSSNSKPNIKYQYEFKEIDNFSEVKDNDFSRFNNQDMIYINRNTDSIIGNQRIIKVKVDEKINKEDKYKTTITKF